MCKIASRMIIERLSKSGKDIAGTGMKGSAVSPQRSPGRPPGAGRTEIPENLICALREILADKPADAVTLREVAARAGTSTEMVRYYFNGKDGLIMAMLDSSLARIRDMLDDMRSEVAAAATGHTRLVIACLAEIYLDENAAAKLFNSEFVRNRKVERADDWAERPNSIVEVVDAVVADLVARGIYRPTLDTGQVAVMMMSLTGYPVRLLETLPTRWIDEGRLRDPAWLDALVEMSERYCLA